MENYILPLWDSNGHELVVFEGVDSARNYVRILNGATDGCVGIYAAGADGNVDLEVLAKGNGNITLGGGVGKVVIQSELTLPENVAQASGVTTLYTLVFGFVGANAEPPIADGDYVIQAGDTLRTRCGVLAAIIPANP